jgi:hypothetical protein
MDASLVLGSRLRRICVIRHMQLDSLGQNQGPPGKQASHDLYPCNLLFPGVRHMRRFRHIEQCAINW